jgi:small-conductance mechanosensitive channel
VSEVNAFEESDRAARVRLEEEFARQIARGLQFAGEVERLEAEAERLRAEVADGFKVAEDLAAEIQHRQRLQAEVERLNDEIIEMRNLWGRDQRRAEKAEAEVERLRKDVAFNPDYEEVANEYAEDIAKLREELNYQSDRANRNDREREQMRAEVERLRAALEQIATTHDWHWGMDVARNALVEEVTAQDNSPR